MKFTKTQALLGVMAPFASAFPAAMMEAASQDPKLAARAQEMTQMLAKRQSGADSATALFEPVPTFDEKAQYIDVSEGSGHEYQAPGPNDLRGPCPGLNAFANHNFLPHNGYATITQFVDVTMSVVGMGTQLALFLAAYGAVIDGSGLAWSIGGTPTAAQAGLLPGGNGLIGSHNKYEGDSSPTRPDLYQAGNNYKTQADQFQQMIDASPGGEVTLDSLTAFRSARFDTQMQTNGDWFNGPFTGVLVQPAAYTFIYRFMANHSEANPVGYLSYDVIKSWFGITGEDGSYVANQGQERIPENWYRRALEYPYEVDYFLGDALAAAALHPKFLDIGGNTGEPNTFTGVDVANLTNGVYNGKTLLEGNNLGCFAYQNAAQAKPDVALAALTKLTSAVTDIVSKLGCPKLEKIDESQLEMFPGYEQSPANQIN